MTPSPTRPQTVLVVDPSLFTAPYDRALCLALQDAGLDVELITRARRDNEKPISDVLKVREMFYKLSESKRAPKAFKAIEHVFGLISLYLYAKKRNATCIHFQWMVIPMIDRLFLKFLHGRIRTVLTVHDVVPFNGSPTSKLQVIGFAQALSEPDALICHTRSARQGIEAYGVDPARINIVPHGPLGLSEIGPDQTQAQRSSLYTFLFFGKVQHYKGLDILIKAFAALPPQVRSQARVVVAGMPMFDVQPLLDLIAEHDLMQRFDLRLNWQSEAEIHDLLVTSDALVFPYREIDASGVFYLTASYQKWVIASRLGAFADAIDEERSGRLVTPTDVPELAEALSDAITHRRANLFGFTSVKPWSEIAQDTLKLYQNKA